MPKAKTPKVKTPKAPRYLNARAREWFGFVVEEFVIESHDLPIVLMMADCLHGYDRAAAELEKAGTTTFTDRFGNVRPRPELATMNQYRITFARLRRELALPVGDVDEPRIPRVNGATK